MHELFIIPFSGVTQTFVLRWSDSDVTEIKSEKLLMLEVMRAGAASSNIEVN